MSAIYIIRGQQIEGPLDRGALDALVRSRQVTDKTPAQVAPTRFDLVIDRWQPLKDVVKSFTAPAASTVTHFGDARDLRALRN